MIPTESSDAELVSLAIAGDRDAFGLIVERYQILICSLAYSRIGHLGQSEDVAQETFITAWKHLRLLREPDKLRAWLCGIVRNRVHKSLDRERRQPVHAAEPLEAADDSPAREALPSDHAISREEMALLWRALEQIPEIYREPLVLFYREHQSIESVAQHLELSEAAVKQRLSRGRKVLQERMLAFVEGALAQTNPGKAFTVGVLAALPVFTLSARAATLGVAAAKGGATAKAAATSGLLSAFLAPALGFFGNYISYRISMDGAQSDVERERIRVFYRKLMVCILGFFVAYGLLMIGAKQIIADHDLVYTSLIMGLMLPFIFVFLASAIWSLQTRRKFTAEARAQGVTAVPATVVWEYRSRFGVLGLPLIHVRINGGLTGREPR